MADCYNRLMVSHTQAALQASANIQSVGRPRAIDESDVRKLSKLFTQGHTIATACRLSGIPRSTYYDELARNEEFSRTECRPPRNLPQPTPQRLLQSQSDASTFKRLSGGLIGKIASHSTLNERPSIVILRRLLLLRSTKKLSQSAWKLS
jgi:hypothetical protein